MTLQAWLSVVYLIANGCSAVLLWCMVQSVFVGSSQWFRFVIGLLGIMCVMSALLGLEALKLNARFQLDALDLLGFVQVVQSVCLALVLAMMRFRQHGAGLHKHPRVIALERASRGC